MLFPRKEPQLLQYLSNRVTKLISLTPVIPEWSLRKFGINFYVSLLAKFYEGRKEEVWYPRLMSFSFVNSYRILYYPCPVQKEITVASCLAQKT